jgi:hypothetical protein
MSLANKEALFMNFKLGTRSVWFAVVAVAETVCAVGASAFAA